MITAEFSDVYVRLRKKERHATILNVTKELQDDQKDVNELLRILGTRFEEYDYQLDKAKKAIQAMEDTHQALQAVMFVLQNRQSAESIV